jgi:hypothetical protein
MMQLYGTAAVQERSTRDDEALARYLRWEYGEGTGVGFLKSWAIGRASYDAKRRFGMIDRLTGLSAAIKARMTATLLDGWRRELTLLVQWKRGELGTLELVNRLEELQRKTKSPVPNPGP